MTVEAVQVPVYRPFVVRVARLQRLSPSFLRVTFTGADLDDFASNGFDQRIKVMLPLPGRGHRRLPGRPRLVRRVAGPARRAADADPHVHDPRAAAARPARSTSTSCCTARPVRPRPGPRRPRVGDEVVLIGPNARFPGPTGGFEWHPPADASCLLHRR